jgi:hybrid cluster-associated redox disulfide protein
MTDPLRYEDLSDPDMSISDIVARSPDTIPVFIRHRMLCVGCLVSPFHTVTDACAEYGLDEKAFMAEIVEAAGL